MLQRDRAICRSAAAGSPRSGSGIGAARRENGGGLYVDIKGRKEGGGINQVDFHLRNIRDFFKKKKKKNLNYMLQYVQINDQKTQNVGCFGY